MKKVLFVATVVKTHINVFHLPYLKMLKEMGYETHVAAKNDFENPKDCIIPNCDYYHNIPFERSPIKKENITSYKTLKSLMLKENFDVVHCHTPVGGAITRLVYKNIKSKIKTKCIYTAHGFHFYKGAPMLNWLLYYPIERYLSKYTDVLITINKEDYQRAKNKFKMKQLEYIPGVGIDLNKFNPYLYNDNQKIEMRKKEGIPEGVKWLITVGELIPRKNHLSLIKAIQNIDNIYLTIAGTGELHDEIQQLINKLNIRNKVKLLGFRNDVSALCSCADFFVFPSFQEGLPVALMEAMASGLPVACSEIRGNIDLIDKQGGVLFNPLNIADMEIKIKYLVNLSAQEIDKMRRRNIDKIREYEKDKVLKGVNEIYLRNVENMRGEIQMN